MKKDSEKILVLDRALRILDMLMLSKHALGVNEIAKKQGITPSAAFRIMKTLASDGWVFQGEDDKYIPGVRLSFVTERNNFHYALSEVAYPVMESLTARETLPMNLVVRQGRRFFILQQTRTTRYVDFVAPIGSDLPLHASAGGKILLCEMPDALRSPILNQIRFDPMTPNTICSPDAFLQELNQVRAQGFALDYYESLNHTCCIGVPVRSPSGEIYAALSFSGITDVHDREDLSLYLPALQQASRRITDTLFSLCASGENEIPDRESLF